MVDTKAMTDDIKKMFNGIPGIENMTATIKAVSPTTVINFLDKDNQENPHHIIGAALLINGLGEYNKNFIFGTTKYTVPIIADMEKIKPGSVIYIKDHQKLEALNIIDGALTLLCNNNVITDKLAGEIINDVINIDNFIVLNRPFIKLPYMDELYKITITEDGKKYSSVINNIIDIISFIWFIPYGKLDEIYDNFVAEYNNSTTENK